MIVNDRGQTVYELKEKGAGTTEVSKGKTTGEGSNKAETAQKLAQKNIPFVYMIEPDLPYRRSRWIPYRRNSTGRE